MEYLDAFQYIEDILALLKCGQRVQVSKEKLSDVLTYLYGIKTSLEKDLRKIRLKLAMERVFQAITATQSLSVEMMPDTVRDTVCEACLQLRYEIAELTYSYFTSHQFDETIEEDVELLRQVIRVKRGLI